MIQNLSTILFVMFGEDINIPLNHKVTLIEGKSVFVKVEIRKGSIAWMDRTASGRPTTFNVRFSHTVRGTAIRLHQIVATAITAGNDGVEIIEEWSTTVAPQVVPPVVPAALIIPESAFQIAV